MKFEKTTLEKPEVFEMAGILEIDADAVIGKLLRVWNWFDDQSRDGHAHVTVMSLLDRYTGVTGFVDAMTKVGWMRVDGDSLSLPNFDRHNGEPAKVRALARTRKQRERSNRDNSVTDCVTKTGQSCDKPVTREEKRIEEKINSTSLTPAGDSLSLDSSPPVSKPRTSGRASDISEVEAFARENKAEHSEALDFWDKMEACGWTKGGGKGKLVDWKAHFRTYHRNGWLASNKPKPNNSEPTFKKFLA